MKVMVSTSQTQGHRKNDFSWTTEGELVKFGMECDGEAVDGKCGCRRSFSGFDSHKAGTTAMVVDRDMTREDFFDKMCEALKQEGWYRPEENEGLSVAEIDEEVDELLNIASGFTTGQIIEKRGNKIQVRALSVKDISDDELEEKIFNYHEAIDNGVGTEKTKTIYNQLLQEQAKRGAKQ